MPAAKVLLVLGTGLTSNLGSLVRYFQGNLLAVVNSREELSDYKADCFCEGNAAEIMAQAYPGNHPPGRGGAAFNRISRADGEISA